jgi:hypothetical protein
LTSRGTWRRPSPSNSARLPAILLACLLAAACGSSKPGPKRAADGAGLVFTRQSGQVSGVWLANADGSSPRQIVANGFAGTLSPDGKQVTYQIPQGTDTDHWLTNIKDVVRGDPRALGEVTVLAWSPDSTHLAVRDGKQLLLLDSRTGETRVLAQGIIGGADFAPDGSAVVFSRGNGKVAPDWRSDIFVRRLADGSESRLTRGGRSDAPVWGGESIAFRRFHFDGDWPVGEIYLIGEHGGDARPFATGKQSPVAAALGLDAVELSADGRKLLACAAGEFHCGPVAYDVPDGAAHDLSLAGKAVTQVEDLSEDGTQVLVTAGAFDGPPRDLYTIPFGGGKPKLVLENVSEAHWSG